MPELPEIEHLRRSLEPHLVGARVAAVELRRADVVRGIDGAKERARTGRIPVPPADLLVGCTITELMRHGKNLAIVADSGAILGVHLGMSGQMRVLAPAESDQTLTHVHCVWRVEREKASKVAGQNGSSARASAVDASLRLIFRDPRRFGGLFVFASLDQLREHYWNRLGPDALTITNDALAAALSGTKRSIKAALLDQSVLAGVGNIYADEALFAAKVHPMVRSDRLKSAAVERVATEVRRVLCEAVAAGGSTLRDYVDGEGTAGVYGASHRVYGRGGLPCLNCRRCLRSVNVVQRTTVFCPTCQCRKG